jgi:hypothetical protein
MENYFAENYERELTKLRDEITKFKDEENIWNTAPGITNPTGTLVLHLLGNLNYTVGAQLGGTGYVRNRDEEFSLRGVSREKLIADINSTLEVVKSSLAGLTQAKLEENYPLEFVGPKSTAFYLTFFYGHFTYHLGFIRLSRPENKSGKSYKSFNRVPVQTPPISGSVYPGLPVSTRPA